MNNQALDTVYAQLEQLPLLGDFRIRYTPVSIPYSMLSTGDLFTDADDPKKEAYIKLNDNECFCVTSPQNEVFHFDGDANVNPCDLLDL